MSFDQLRDELTARKSQSLYRQRRMLESPQAPEVQVDGKRYLAFCSNDYLGLANHPDVIQALKQGADQYGVGGGASHLVNGHSLAHHELEEALAEFTGRPRALLFSTGYMANLGAVNALLDKRDAVFEDRINHASLLDAGLLSGARFQRYLHNDAQSLTQRLERSDARRKLVVTDGVFSMDGDIADLPELCKSAEAQNAWVMVDDAHGFGVALQVHFPSLRIVKLGHQADIGQRYICSVRKLGSHHHLFESSQAFADEMPHPGLHRNLLTRLLNGPFCDTQIADRVYFHRDRVGKRPDFGAFKRSGWQQTEFPGLVQVFDLCKGLRQTVAIDFKHGNKALRVP